MSKILKLLFILLIPAILSGQQKEYKSKEQKKYYKKLKHKNFSPLSKRQVLNYENEFFKVVDCKNYTKFNDTLYFTPYQDSLYKIMFNQTSNDSILSAKPHFIGRVEKNQILKYERNDQLEAFIFTSSKFEDIFFGESGIWVAFSTNKGKSWEYYYTGIVQRQPLFLKWYSRIPLIKSKNELQIEACLLRQLTPFTHPGPGPSYEVVKDGLQLIVDLATLRKDSDYDGLTDIIETKFYTNPHNKDTDGDGIPDNLDLNPRISVQRTDRTAIFEFAVNEGMSMFDTTGLFVSSQNIPMINYATDTTETILIVTNNLNIQSIQPKSTRVIILSEKEYKKLKGKYQNRLNRMSISPLFKVDNEKNAFVFTRNFNTWGEEYLVKKTKYGWKILVISSWIS